MDFDSLSNQEIYKALSDRGVKTGGINATTRNLYINKLKQIVAEECGGVDLNSSGDQIRSNGYDNGVHDKNDDEIEPVVVSKVYPQLTETVKRRSKKEKSPLLLDEAEDSDYGEESSRVLSEEEVRNIREMSYSRRSPVQNGSSWIRTILKTIGITLFLMLLYFIFDSANKNFANQEDL